MIVETGRIAFTGATGQLGRAIQAAAPDSLGLGRDRLDLSKPRQSAAALDAVLQDNPDVIGVINAAAHTAVDRAEDEEALAQSINGEAPGALAAVCASRGVPFVHISTDYVFAGDASTPYAADAPTAPLNAYGRTKLAGERAVLAAGGAAAMLRTSWVYDTRGKNFLTTMLRLAASRDTLSVVADQIGRPTFAGDLADAAIAALHRLRRDEGLRGVYHVSNTGPATSWADFARAIFAVAGTGTQVVPIPASDYPTPARRPAYSVLDTTGFETAFGHALPDWRDALARALAAHPEAMTPQP